MKKPLIYFCLFLVVVNCIFLITLFLFIRYQTPQEKNIVSSILPGIVKILDAQKNIIGAGAVVHESGYILTSAHLLETAEKVQDFYGKEYVIVSRAENGLHAFIKILPDADFRRLPVLQITPLQDLFLGERVYAFGVLGLTGSVVPTEGIVSALHEKVPVLSREGVFIQTNIVTHAGFSGGPLVNGRGEIVGVNTGSSAVLGFSWASPLIRADIPR